MPSATSVLAMRDTSRVLRTQISLVNRGESPVYLEYGACATRVLAYRTSAPGAPPVWDSDKRRMWSFGQGVVCLMYLATTTVAPGATFAPGELKLDVSLMDVLGDSLPDGHYYFRASAGFSNRPAIADIPAGDLDIAFARPPLATTRRSFILEWTAAPVTLSGDAVRAVAVGTVVNANTALVSLAPVECPLQLRVYRDRAQRDAAPRSGAPDWTQPMCTAPLRQKGVRRGERETYETAIPVRDILGSSLPSGRYYFAVMARAEGMEMVLSAGELDLTR